MRISLIYGEDTGKAYNKHRELIDGAKAKGFEIISANDIKNITGQNLFEDKIVYVLADAKKISLADWKWFSQNNSKYNSNLLVYWQGNMPVGVLKNFPKDTKKEKFELPKIIFQFLDSFYPGNSRNSLKLLNELLNDQPIELVFYFLSRHLRDLYWATVSSDTMGMPSWRVKKLAQQSGKFSHEKVTFIISELALIDVQAKRGEIDLKSSLDLLIIKHLE